MYKPFIDLAIMGYLNPDNNNCSEVGAPQFTLDYIDIVRGEELRGDAGEGESFPFPMWFQYGHSGLIAGIEKSSTASVLGSMRKVQSRRHQRTTFYNSAARAEPGWLSQLTAMPPNF